MTKYDQLTELYEETVKNIALSPENWRNFLKAACRNYKLRFDEQILVYAQRPDATAVLQMDRWNKHFGRWVERGSKGIAVFANAERRKQDIIRYFDVSDTQEGKYSRPVPLWNMQVDDTVDVVNCLNNAFGVGNISIIQAVKDVAKKLSDEKIDKYLHDLTQSVSGSYLEDLDELNLTVEYRNLLQSSVAYITLSRLGFNADDYFDENTFDSISDFSTPVALNSLGVAVRNISVIELGEISKTIISKSYGKTLALNRERDYNKTENKSERSFDNDERDSIQGGRKRIPDARPETSGTARGGFGAIRNGSQEISAGGTPHNIYEPADLSTAHSASPRGGAESESVRGEAGTADDGKRRSDGTAQSRGYDELGEKGEQHKKQSTRDSQRSSDLQHLNENLDYYDRSHEDKSLPFFGNDNDISYILLNAPIGANKDEIRAFFEANADNEARISYIKGIFNVGITELSTTDGRTFGYEKMENVLHLWEGRYEIRTAQSYYNWPVISSYYEGLMLLGKLTEQTEQTESEFTFTQEIIDRVICMGGNVEQGKMRIYEQFQKSLSSKENEDFLKKEYGWGGSYPVITGTGIDEQHDGKGIRLQRGFGDENPHITLTWLQVEKRISELIRDDKYLTPEEKIFYPVWLDQQEQLKAERESEKKKREAIASTPETPATSNNAESMESLNGHSMKDYEDYVIAEAEAVLEELGEEGENIRINGARVYGSRSRETLSRPDSDVDVVLSYTGQLPEDFFFNLLHEHPLSLYGLNVDVNPISTEKTGTLEDYMVKANAYLDEKANQISKEAKKEAEPETDVTHNFEINYRLLSRMQSDCEYYINHGGKGLEKYLWAGSVDAQIEKMRYYYESVPEKPEWLTAAQIDDYAQQMKALEVSESYQYKVGTNVYIGTGKFEITAIDNNKIQLADANFPMIIKEISRQEFEEKIAENPMNNFLKVTVTEVSVAPEALEEPEVKTNDILEVYQHEKHVESEAQQKLKHEGITINLNSEYGSLEIVFPDKPSPEIRDLLKENKFRWHSQKKVWYGYGHREDIALKLLEVLNNTKTHTAAKDMPDNSDAAEVSIDSSEDFLDIDVNAINEELKRREENNDHSFVDMVMADVDRIDSIDNGLTDMSFDELVRVSDDEMAKSINEPEPAKEYEISPEHKAETEVIPSWMEGRRNKVDFYDVHPEVPEAARVNFDLCSHPVEVVGKKERFQRNIEAINVIKECKFENRLATPEEQIKLSKYVGWGGLPEAFDEKNTAWANEFIELQIALDPDEYAAARESTLTAFFTPPEVISAIYKVMENLGFQKGNILEPACGIGNFMGMLPESMKESHMYGVELDSISAQISQQLYQKNSIVAQGFEETNFQDNFFDAVIGNVPFGDFKVADKRYDKQNFLIHDYFFGATRS